MGTVQQLAETVKEGLQAAHPTLRQTVIHKLALAVGAMLEAKTPNTIELANGLPVPTERQELREPGRRRLLTQPRVASPGMLEPFARTVLEAAADHGPPILLSVDPTELGNRLALLMLAGQVGDRSLPVAWKGAAVAAKLGFNSQPVLLERVRTWLPAGAAVLRLGARV